jgi:hypothetical protein
MNTQRTAQSTPLLKRVGFSKTWTWPLPPNPIINAVSFTGGLVTGYRHKGYNSDVAVMGATSLHRDLDNRQALRLSILPLHKRSSATYVLHLSYEVKLKN